MIETAPQTWEPGHYLKFADLRVRPALDLLARIPVNEAAHITDLGCGAGNITPLLCERWAEAAVTALDSSAEMLARAQAEHPTLGVRWQLADVRDWAAQTPQDVIFSNAVLHWVDDHQALFPRLMGELAPDGVMAVQMPNQFAEPSHALMREVAAMGPWSDILKPLLREAPVAEMGQYYEWLQPHADTLDIWETTYAQTLDGEDAVLDWIGSTALKPLLEALDDVNRQMYRETLADALNRAYPQRADGKTVFPFRRLFIVATKAA